MDGRSSSSNKGFSGAFGHADMAQSEREGGGGVLGHTYSTEKPYTGNNMDSQQAVG